jgi:hypothetical protein
MNRILLHCLVELNFKLQSARLAHLEQTAGLVPRALSAKVARTQHQLSAQATPLHLLVRAHLQTATAYLVRLEF